MNQVVPVESFYCRIATCFLAWIVSSDHFSQVDVPLEASSTIIPLSPWPSTWYSDDDIPSKLEQSLQERIFDMASGKLFILFSLQLLFLILKHWKKISEKKKKESISIIYYAVSFFYIFLFFFFFSYVDSGNIFPSIIFLMLRNFMKSKSLKLVSCSWNYFV